MRTLEIGNKSEYQVAVLLKGTALSEYALTHYYIAPVISLSKPTDFIGMELSYFDKKKPTIKEMRDYLTETVLPKCRELNVKVLYCTDGNYLKAMLGVNKIDPLVGYVLKCKLKGYEDLDVIYSVNHQALFTNDNLYSKLYLANKTLADYLKGEYRELGSGVINSSEYIECNAAKVKEALAKLHKYTSLSCDIETFSLNHDKAGLGTIAFAWDKHNGICINVEHEPNKQEVDAVLAELKQFFIEYKESLLFHNAPFDIKCLIYKLFMKDLIDTAGLIEGLKTLTRNFEDTKIITYLATNTCSGNKLSLKEQAHEYVGNYAVEDIKDITKIEPKELMEYNLIDCLATWHVFNKHHPVMLQDEQKETYAFFKKILVNIIQMELTGLPIDIEQVEAVDKQLGLIEEDNFKLLEKSETIRNFIYKRKQEICKERNDKYVKKVIEPEDVNYVFNPNSGKELIKLIHDTLGYDVHDITETGLPKVNGESLQLHCANAKCEEHAQIFTAICEILESRKIRNTFIKTFLEAPQGPDGWNYLFGSFNLGGTLSGRLSSSSPNMQNIPSKGKMGKLVKSCFSAPKGIVEVHLNRIKKHISEPDKKILKQIQLLSEDGIIKANKRTKFDELYKQLSEDYSYAFYIDAGWIFYGIDFNALEDRVNTLLTKDPNKMKIYTEGYDSHCFRTVAYNKDVFAHIDPTDVNQVNGIVDTPIGKKLRQESKAASFALSYQGTYHTLMKNCGFSESDAKRIEANYHQLYKVSDAWTQSKIDQASLDGYVTLAFGLRLRTPVLAKTILNTRVTPNQAQQEARTAGNAVSGQSYCLLNSRAGVELQERVFNSEYALDIRPSAHIHDAEYGMVRNTPEAVKWLNDNIVECIEWQELPEIQHDIIKLSGNLELFYPHWGNPIELPNRITVDAIVDICKQSL